MIKLINEVIYKSRLFLLIKIILLGRRKTHYINVDKVVHAILFVIQTQLTTNPSIYIVSDDGPWNSLKNIYKKMYSIVYKNGELPVYPILPAGFIKLILSIFNKGVDSNTVYKSDRIRKDGLVYKTTFEEDLERYMTAHQAVNTE